MNPDSPNTIILVSPSEPYVCIGYHQDLEEEVDLGYCRQAGLPVLRREVGGGAVYLDSGQVFCQWVFHRRDLPMKLSDRFVLYARPLIETYRALGIEASYRPVNDIHVAGKKIGGMGAATMGQAEVVVGSLMFTFDKQQMARVLRVPSVKMRDKVYQSLQEYITTMTEQLGYTPDRQTVVGLYLDRCAEVLKADLFPAEPTPAELSLAEELDTRFMSDQWLHQKGGLRRPGIKIHEDVHVGEVAFKAPGGLIRVTARLARGHIEDLSLSGDFNVLPAVAIEALEQALLGVPLAGDQIRTRVEDVYRRLEVQSPGVDPEDWTRAVMMLSGAA